MARHWFVEHTGEVELRLDAPDPAGLFVEAGRALAGLMLDEAGAPSPCVEEVIVEADDRAGLLFEWINELVYLSETRKLVYTDFDIEQVSDCRLVAHVRGVEPRSIRTAVKAATFHRLAVEQTADGLAATVVLDV